MKSCQQDVLKSILARGLKLGLLIGDDEYITWLSFEEIQYKKSGVVAFANLSILNLSARYLEKSEWNLASKMTWNYFN